MASPNPDAANTSTTTKQITMAAFKKYMEKATNKQDRHPSRSPHPPTSDTEVGTRDSLHPQTSNSPSPPLSPSAITPTTLSDPEDCWSEESTGCRHTSLSGPTQVNIAWLNFCAVLFLIKWYSNYRCYYTYLLSLFSNNRRVVYSTLVLYVYVRYALLLKTLKGANYYILCM